MHKHFYIVHNQSSGTLYFELEVVGGVSDGVKLELSEVNNSAASAENSGSLNQVSSNLFKYRVTITDGVLFDTHSFPLMAHLSKRAFTVISYQTTNLCLFIYVMSNKYCRTYVC